jgi:ketosteroid isomerase-like protein
MAAILATPSSPIGKISVVSASDVELVREVMDLMNAAQDDPGAMARLEELIAPDVRIDMSRRVFNPDVYDGHDGLRRLAREVDEVWDEFHLEAESFVDEGDRVLVTETRRGRGKGSGLEVEQRATVAWTVRDGRIASMQVDPD